MNYCIAAISLQKFSNTFYNLINSVTTEMVYAVTVPVLLVLYFLIEEVQFTMSYSNVRVLLQQKQTCKPATPF